MFDTDDLVIRWLNLNSRHYRCMCRHIRRQRYSGYKYVLFDLFDVLNKIFEFINFVYLDSYAKPRFPASFHESSDVVTPGFLPNWGQGIHLNGARDASHTPWCLILACFNHLSNCLAPVGI